MRVMADWYVLEGDTCPGLRARFEYLQTLAEDSVFTKGCCTFQRNNFVERASDRITAPDGERTLQTRLYRFA